MRYGTFELAGRKVRSVAERPRERLLTFGPQALTDVELLAVVLGTGFGGHSALELARDALDKAGGTAAMLSSGVASRRRPLIATCSRHPMPCATT